MLPFPVRFLALWASLNRTDPKLPFQGTFPHFAARWFDPALGFAVGWVSFIPQTSILF